MFVLLYKWEKTDKQMDRQIDSNERVRERDFGSKVENNYHQRQLTLIGGTGSPKCIRLQTEDFVGGW